MRIWNIKHKVKRKYKFKFIPEIFYFDKFQLTVLLFHNNYNQIEKVR
jgi:hypothetical protein